MHSIATTFNPRAIIPSAEMPKFAGLPEEAKRDFCMWSKIIQEIDAAKSKRAMFTEIARRYQGVRSMTSSNIKTKYYNWRNDGWTALLDFARLKSHQAAKFERGQTRTAAATKSPAFIYWWKSLQESYQRSSAAAYDELVRIYRSNDGQIPGLGNWRNEYISQCGSNPPKHCPLWLRLPEGYSKRNLQRIKPDSVELALMRQGLSAARNMLPKLHTTRKGAEVGQRYVFDDMQHNLLVRAPGNKEVMRPLEFACQDAFSAMRFAWLIQPMRRNEETGRREMLRETEMRWLVAHVLCTVGYNPDGCVLQVEHGTAAIRPDLELFLGTVTGGEGQIINGRVEWRVQPVIRVKRGAIHNKPGHAGAFAPKGKGNSRSKGNLESQHSLVQNVLANLPAQMGKDRDHSPEQLHGLKVYESKLLAAAAELPPERAALLQSATLDITKFRAVVREAYNNINARTDHNLEGWEEAELTVEEYRLSLKMEWEDQKLLLSMDEDDQALRRAIIAKDPDNLTQCRKLSPVEVFARGTEKLVRLPYCYYPEIVGRKNAKELRLNRDHEISFMEKRLGPGHHRFHGIIKTENGELVELQEKTTYLVYATPADLSAVFVCDMDNVFLGIAPAMHVPCMTDTEGINHQYGRLMHEHNMRLADVRRRHEPEAQAMQDMLAHNAAVLAGQPITPEELFRAGQIEEAEIDSGDLEAATLYGRDRYRTDEEFTDDEITSYLT